MACGRTYRIAHLLIGDSKLNTPGDGHHTRQRVFQIKRRDRAATAPFDDDVQDQNPFRRANCTRTIRIIRREQLDPAFVTSLG